ncbi:hypothetical protein NIF40_00440 [[Clostridium] leptum]|nr:hypothetical protein [[Clostridium] leptum]
MKRLTRLLVFAVVLSLLCASLSACSGKDGKVTAGFNPNNLLRPPRLTGDQAGVQKALSDNISKKYTLKYPRSGDYRSAVVYQDLNGDGLDEVLAFYKLADESLIHIMMLQCEIDENGQESWSCVSDTPAPSSEMEFISFEDLDDDGRPEVITGWRSASPVENQIVVHSMQGNSLSQRFSEKYTEAQVVDLDDDGILELLLISLDSTTLTASANLYKLQKGSDGKSSFDLMGTTPMDGYVSSGSSNSPYASVAVGELRPGITAVFVDGYKSSTTSSASFTSSITEVLYWRQEDSQLVNLFFNAQTQTVEETYRPVQMVSSDINGDGWIEIPSVRELPGYEKKPEADKLWLTNWMHYNGYQDESQGFDKEVALSCVMNKAEGYYFSFPDEWLGYVTAQNQPGDRTLTFYRWDSSSNPAQMGEPLLHIRVVQSAQWNASPPEGYFRVMSKGDIVLAAQITDAGLNDEELGLSENMVISSLSWFNS